MSQKHQHIKEVALIGTVRKQFVLEELSPAIKNVISDNSEVEDQLLQAMSLDCFYQKAGTQLPVFEGEIKEQPIQEHLPEMEESYISILRLIKETNHLNQKPLFVKWLTIIIESKKIVAPEMILEVIKLAQILPKKHQPMAYHAIGNKGQQLIEQFKNYQLHTDNSALVIEDKTIWLEGNKEQRIRLLKKSRSLKPESAWVYLNSTWNTESIRDKKSFLEIIYATAVDSDLPQIQNLYKNEFAYSPKERKTDRECRQYLAASLLKIQDAQFAQSVIEQIKTYIKIDKKGKLMKVLSNKGNKRIILPTEEDNFFNGDNMDKTFGFDRQTQQIDLFATNILYWFSQIVEMIPLSKWAELVDLSKQKTITYFLTDKQFLNNIKGKEKSNLLNALYNSGRIHQDSEAILLFYKSLAQDEKYLFDVDSLSYFSQQEWETFILSQGELLNPQYLTTWKEENGEWSDDFSKEWLTSVVNKIKKQNLFDYQLGKIAANLAPASLLPLLKKINDSWVNNTDNIDYWHKHIYSPMREVLEIKQKINEYK